MLNIDLLTDRARNLLAGQLALPLFIVIAGAIYNAIFPPPDYWLDADVVSPIFWAVVSWLLAIKFLKQIGKPIERSGKNMLIGFGQFIPYLFSLYVMGYMGAYTVYRDFSVGGAIYGTIMIFAGFWILFVFWQITEIAIRADKIQSDLSKLS